MENIYYHTGEYKPCRLQAYSRDDPSARVIVVDARWQLHTRSGAPVSSGACTVTEDGLITWLMRIDAPGVYCLRVEYRIGVGQYVWIGKVVCDDCH